MKFILTILVVFLLVACGSTQHKAAQLSEINQPVSIGQIWRTHLQGAIEFPLQSSISQSNTAMATSAGVVTGIQTQTGQIAWQIKLGTELTAGVGFAGEQAAVISEKNELIAIKVIAASKQASVQWRRTLNSRTYSAPMIAGGRIFVLLSDRTLQAYDAETGALLWESLKSNESLVLNQAGTLGVYKNVLIAGGSGRLYGVNPDNGRIIWDVVVSTSRATNDIERLIDLVGAPNRVGDSICVRAYQSGIACVDASKGLSVWRKTTAGNVGVGGDAGLVISTESDGRVKAWNRQSGEQLWVHDKLAHRGLSAPLVVGNSIVVGDAQGYVHVLNKQDGSFTARFETDGSAVVSAPILAGTVVMITTTKGNVFAYSPQ
jgi:outer membrane protein assembly factor BamB